MYFFVYFFIAGTGPILGPIQGVLFGPIAFISTWVIYGVIFVYYLIATLFPIDAIIGRIYPIFGLVLLFSAIGVFFG
ncbi:MAG: hypothetical protein ACI4VG_04815, partial [Lachnospiraceae bacterium]